MMDTRVPGPGLPAADLLTPDELQGLRRRSDLRGLWCVAHAWLVILGCMVALAMFPHPLVWLAGVMIVGARQLGLAILMHDAAHGVLTERRGLNEWLGQYACSWPLFADMHAYRAYHLKHHRHTQQAADPDLSLSVPFPITRASFRRKILRDLTGQTMLKQRLAQFRKGVWRLRGAIGFNLGFLLVLTMAGQWHLFFLLWVVPYFTWFPMVTRIRNIAEHAMVPDNDDPFRNARTTHADLLWRALVAPYWVNYHVEHHLIMYIPCYRLARFHRLLMAKGYGDRMELQPGYLPVLGLATSRAAS
jgi:fatty acid desaturase